MAITLSRVDSRNDIPEAVLALRDEFARARTQLWTTVDDALIRAPNETDVARMLRDINSAIDEIVPSAFRSNDMWFPFRLSAFKRLLMLDFAGFVEEFTEETVKTFLPMGSNLHILDAAGILRTNILGMRELNSRLERILSRYELDCIRLDIEKSQ